MNREAGTLCLQSQEKPAANAAFVARFLRSPNWRSRPEDYANIALTPVPAAAASMRQDRKFAATTNACGKAPGHEPAFAPGSHRDDFDGRSRFQRIPRCLRSRKAIRLAYAARLQTSCRDGQKRPDR